MRFEPRLIRPDEPDDSLELPADLAELAEQLSADADYLAARYPAHADAQPVSGVDRGRRLVRGVAVAVLLTGIGLWGGRLWRNINRPEQPMADAVSAVEDLRSGSLAADDAAVGLAADAAVNPRAGGSGGAGSSGLGSGGAALLFRSLSGGEQEGVLDLLEEQSSDEAPVSI
jgi:hypothetical protein